MIEVTKDNINDICDRIRSLLLHQTYRVTKNGVDDCGEPCKYICSGHRVDNDNWVRLERDAGRDIIVIEDSGGMYFFRPGSQIEITDNGFRWLPPPSRYSTIREFVFEIQTTQIDRLIEGLKILRSFAPDPELTPSHIGVSVGDQRIIDQISKKEISRLRSLDWEERDGGDWFFELYPTVN